MWADSDEAGSVTVLDNALARTMDATSDHASEAAVDFWNSPAHTLCRQPDLRIATKWCVITGAPSSGKTTVIQELGRRGFCVKHDLVRSFIEDQLAHGRSLEDVRGNSREFYRNVLKINVRAERSLNPSELIIFDNAIPDNLAYQTINDVPLGEDLLAASTLFRYRTVFVFDRFPIHEDGVRKENNNIAAMLDQLLEHAYQRLGYEVVRVPRLPVAERVEFVMRKLDY